MENLVKGFGKDLEKIRDVSRTRNGHRHKN